MTEFVRERRYIAVKIKHMTADQVAQVDALINSFNLPPLECVCIESDWPEYEVAWKMIEDRWRKETI